MSLDWKLAPFFFLHVKLLQIGHILVDLINSTKGYEIVTDHCRTVLAARLGASIWIDTDKFFPFALVQVVEKHLVTDQFLPRSDRIHLVTLLPSVNYKVVFVGVHGVVKSAKVFLR